MTILHFVVALVVGGAAALLVARLRGVRDLVAGLLKTGSWFALAGAAFWFMLRMEWTSLLLGAGAGLVLYAIYALLDEVADRGIPSFRACLRREVHSLFATPIPYFVLFLFVVLTGIFFWGNLSMTRAVSVRYVFDSVSSLCFFLFPLLTMGLFARERSEGTIEVLMTAPASDVGVVSAKFFGTMAFYGVMLAPTVAYCLILYRIGEPIGKPDLGPTLSAYLGMVLAGGFFISVGLFTSSLTSSQILAALLSWVLIIFFLLSGAIANVFDLGGTWIGDVFGYVDPIGTHLSPFLRGVIDPKDVIFFLSFTVFFLFLTVRSVESRKWR